MSVNGCAKSFFTYRTLHTSDNNNLCVSPIPMLWRAPWNADLAHPKILMWHLYTLGDLKAVYNQKPLTVVL